MSMTNANTQAPARAPVGGNQPPANNGSRRRRNVEAFSGINPPSDTDNSPEAAELREALRQAELDDLGQGNPAPVTPPAQNTQAPPSQRPPAQAPSGQTIPKARFDQVYQEGSQWRERALHFEAIMRARGIDPANPNASVAPPPAPAPAAGNPPANPDVAAQAAELEAQIVAAAEKFDEGISTLAEYEKARFKLQNQISVLREQNVLAFVASKAPPPAPAQALSMSDRQALNQQAAALSQKHPWAAHLSHVDLKAIEQLVLRDYDLRGKAFPEGPEGRWVMNQAIALWSDFIGPLWYPGVDITQLATTAAQPAAQPTNGNGQSPVPVAPVAPRALPNAVDAAFLAASNHPPNTSNIGAPGSASGELSDEQFMAMSEDARMALPPATLERMFNKERRAPNG